MTGGRLWTLLLLTQGACAANRYAISDELAGARSDRQWSVAHEPPPEPRPAPAPPAPEVAAPSREAEPAAASSSPDSAPSKAEFAPSDAPDASVPPTEASSPAEPAPTAESTPPAAAPVATRSIADERIDLIPDGEVGPPRAPKLQRMVWSLSLRLGGTFGSDEMLTAIYTDGSEETLHSGNGVSAFIGTAVTPFKVGRHSFGAVFEGGWRSSSIGENSNIVVSFSRKSLVPRVQYGFDLKPGIVWITSAGPQYEFDIEFKATGDAVGTIPFDNALGFAAETGLLLDLGFLGLDCTLRHTRITYRGPEVPSLNGNNFGVFVGVDLGLLKADNTGATPGRH